MVPSFRVPASAPPPRAAGAPTLGWRAGLLLLLLSRTAGTGASVTAANTTAYCTRNANVNATGRARVTPLPNIKLSIVLERNEGSIEVYEGQGNMSVITGDGEAVWAKITNFSKRNKDAMIVVVRNNFGDVNVHRDERLGDDDYYYDTSKDREKNGQVMEVAHFGENKGVMEISAGTSQALLVILKNAAAAALTSDGDGGDPAGASPDNTEEFATFAATASATGSGSATATNGTAAKPLRLETCNLYDLMGVNAAKCYAGCPVVSRGGGTLRASAQQCVHKVSEICSCRLFLQGGRNCIKRVMAEQCKHTVPSAARFSQATIRQYTRFCKSGMGT